MNAFSDKRPTKGKKFPGSKGGPGCIQLIQLGRWAHMRRLNRSEKYNPGDILEMIVDAQSENIDDPTATGERERRGRASGSPIISVNGKDVEWKELELRPRGHKAA